MLPGWAEALLRLIGPLFIVGVLVFAGTRGLHRKLPQGVQDGPDDEPYRIYTRDFDLELSATEAIESLRTSSPDFARGHLQHEDYLWQQWVDRTESLLTAKAAELAVHQDETDQTLRAALGPIPASDLVAALLIDQSGSMKGEPMASAAVAATLLSQALERVGIRTEILGFSTAGWRGGRAYSRWLTSGRPKRPGRLCALRHVVYKHAEEPSLSDEARRAMVHPDLLRENVDGEALLWAHDRLSRRPERHSLLIVISDGAPVDDATLAHNGLNYLYRHLMTVLRQLESDPQLVLGALGIGHRVDEYYSLSEAAILPEQLSQASLRLAAAALERCRDRVSAFVEPGPPQLDPEPE